MSGGPFRRILGCSPGRCRRFGRRRAGFRDCWHRSRSWRAERALGRGEGQGSGVFRSCPVLCDMRLIGRIRAADGREHANLATIRAAVIAAIKDAGYLHIPEGRRGHTTPPRPSASTASIK